MDVRGAAQRWWPITLVAVLLSGMLFGVLSDAYPLDWDTYQRLSFISMYTSTVPADTHILYHEVLNVLANLMGSSARAVFFMTATFWGALLVAVDGIARARGLVGMQRAYVLGFVVLASPGIWSLTLMAEDNASYWAPLLVFLHLMIADRDTPSRERRRGVVAGVMLTIALLMNITALIFFVIIPIGVFAWWTGRRSEALRTGTAAATALGLYVVYHLTLGQGGDAALTKYLIEAAALRDFGDNSAPTLSTFRFQQFTWGARAMFLTPTAHRMTIPSELSWWFMEAGPRVILLLYACIALWTYQNRERSPEASWRLLRFGVVGITLAFPYLYEPTLIERWDLFWLCLVLGAMQFVKQRPTPWVTAAAVAATLLQLMYTSVLFRNHFESLWAHAGQTGADTIIERVRTDDLGAIIVPRDIDRYLLAAVTYHAKGVEVALIGERPDGNLECYRVTEWLSVFPASCDIIPPMLQSHNVLVSEHAEAALIRLAEITGEGPESP